MTSILLGSLLISVLHALIPNHWLPILAIGKKEKWSLAETMRVTFLSGFAHVVSTVLLGVLLAIFSIQLSQRIEKFSSFVAPVLLILLGIYFLIQHYRHHHFHIHPDPSTDKKKIIFALIGMMFLSPCLEIEGFFVMSGKYGWQYLMLLSVLYALISLTGMLFWIQVAYRATLKYDWHKLEHNAGMITGLILVLTGILSLYIH